MGLRDRLTDTMKDAMRAKDAKRLSTVRLILASVKDRDIAMRTDGSRDGVGDDEILIVLAKMIKQREESAAIYESGGRPELAEGERAEIAIIREFMPAALSAEETRAAVAAAITATGAGTIKDMGKVMAALKERHAGSMDFAKAGPMVKELLSTPKS
jgi:uncharacterized protein YqeY